MALQLLYEHSDFFVKNISFKIWKRNTVERKTDINTKINKLQHDQHDRTITIITINRN